MPQQKIIPIVEGDGDEQAVPYLLNQLLRLRIGSRFDLAVAPAKNAGSRSKLTRENGLERFLQYARLEKDCAAILVLLDADDACPGELAYQLAQRARGLYPPIPTAVVCAKCEYEAWFLASLETIAGKTLDGRPGLPTGLQYDRPVEALRDVKRWLSQQMPPGRAYKETQDQIALTQLLDFDLVRQRSRSFRRLEHALDELLQAIGKQSKDFVSPLPHAT